VAATRADRQESSILAKGDFLYLITFRKHKRVTGSVVRFPNPNVSIVTGEGNMPAVRTERGIYYPPGLLKLVHEPA